MALLIELSWIPPKLISKGPIEVRHVSEPTIKRDIEDFGLLCGKAHRRFSQPRPPHVLVRGKAR
jgi:hypothetical protein